MKYSINQINAQHAKAQELLEEVSYPHRIGKSELFLCYPQRLNRAWRKLKDKPHLAMNYAALKDRYEGLCTNYDEAEALYEEMCKVSGVESKPIVVTDCDCKGCKDEHV